jgi:hypothetical protein
VPFINYPCISLQGMGRKKNEISNSTDNCKSRINLAFGDLGTDAGLSALNEFMSDKSYVAGFLPSQADIILFEALSAPPLHSYPHALRWFLHIQSFGSDRKNFTVSLQVRWLFLSSEFAVNLSFSLGQCLFLYLPAFSRR